MLGSTVWFTGMLNYSTRILRALRITNSLRAAVDAELDRLESNGIFYPVEASDWAASPTVNVPKMKKGKMSVRICGDYKQLNLAIEIK